MPDLEARIREWKRSLLSAFGGSSEIVEELESHLREEIDRQTQRGQQPEAALAAAQAKLGRPADLAVEYARAAPPVSWLPIWICLAPALLFLGVFAYAVCLPMLWAGGQVLLVAHIASLVAGYVIAFYAGLVGACYVAWWLFRPISLGQRRLLGHVLFLANVCAAILLLCGVILGMVWGQEHLGSAWSNDPREISTALAVLWFAVMAGLWWFAPRKQHLWVLGSVLGSTVGVWAWFGPLLFPQWQNPRMLHAYGGVPLVILYALVICTVVPLAVALLGMLPPGSFRRQPVLTDRGGT